MKTRTRKLESIFYTVATLILVAGAATVLADEPAQARISSTTGGQGNVRSELTMDELAPLLTSGDRTGTTRGGQSRAAAEKTSKFGAVTSSAASSNDFWIYDSRVELYADVDGDGYFAGIDLEFDADTIYSVADVYAVLYLSYDYGPWNEYAVTETFSIYGASGDDEYFVESDLVSGYITGDYDILVELFDAYDDAFVASFGPEDTSELSFLPLEDIGRDTPISSSVTINRGGGGGAFGIFALLLLTIAAARRHPISR